MSVGTNRVISHSYSRRDNNPYSPENLNTNSLAQHLRNLR